MLYEGQPKRAAKYYETMVLPFSHNACWNGLQWLCWTEILLTNYTQRLDTSVWWRCV